MLGAREILAIGVTALFIILWSYAVGLLGPSVLPEFVACGCFEVVGLLIAYILGYLVWPQDDKPKAQPLYGRRQPCSDVEAWEKLLEAHADELADLRQME